jgi:hypothetical protein
MQSYGATGPDPVAQGLDLSEYGWDEDEVKRIVRQELDAAVGQDGGSLAQERLQAQKFFNGEPFGDEVEGRSQIVLRTVMEAIEWVLPALLRIFTASGQIAIVEPPAPQLEQQARQATEYLNHVFYRDNPGFMILHDWFFDALLEKLGWVKYYWDTQKKIEAKPYTGLTQEQYNAILGQDYDIEIVSERRYLQDIDEFNMDRPAPPPPVAMGPPMGLMGGPMPVPPTQVELIDITIKVTREHGRIVIENVPPEEILFSQRAKRGDVPFLAHRRRYTKSDLLQQGYDEATLDLVPTDDSAEQNQERIERFRLDDGPSASQRTGAGKEIWVEDSYVYLSRDDKESELYRVRTAGKGLIILTKDGEPDIECVDETGFVYITPMPQPHQLVGMSLADLTLDIQHIKSGIFRQMLDNAYLTNWPRIEIADQVVNENTYDDLLTLRPGGVVRTRRLGGIQPLMIPYTADKSFPLVDYMDRMAQVRTGVEPSNQAISADAIAKAGNQTASGIAMIQQQSAQRVELFARIFAYGVEQLMRGILGLVRKHQQQERMIRVTGGWLQVDPRQWRDEMPVTVSVGLGTGNRDQILAHLMQVVQLQGQIVMQQGGPNGPLVYPKNVYDALTQLQEAAGFKQSFFADPSQPPPPGPPPQPPKPDPAMIKAQAAVQAVQAKAQADAQVSQGKATLEAQLQQQKAEMEARLAQQRLSHELAMEQQRTEHEMEMERQKSANDIVIERERARAQAEAQLLEIRLKAEAGAYSPQPRQSNGNGSAAG